MPQEFLQSYLRQIPLVFKSKAAIHVMNTYKYLRRHCVLVAGILLLAYFPALSGQESTENKAAEKTVPAIYLAAKQGNLQRVRELIAAGNDVNAVNASGRSALMSAVQYRNRGIVRELLIEGADVNKVDTQGRSALMLAVMLKDMEMIDTLLAAGADANLADKAKSTAISIAERTKNKKLIKKLQDSAG